jgi:hypothetical protein
VYINIYIYMYPRELSHYVPCPAKVTRLLPVLPALDAVAASLVVTVAAAVAAAVREQKLSPQQGGRIAAR